MLSRRALFGLVATVATGSLGGCLDALGGDGEEPPVEAIELQITDVRAPEVGLTSATIPVVFSVVNTHAEEDIPSPTIDYNAFVNDVEVLSSRTTVATLGPGDEASETIELVAEYTDLGAGIIDAIEQGSFEVRIAGSIESQSAETSFSDELYS